MARMTQDSFVRSLSLLNIERSYNFKNSFEVTTMHRVLCDEDEHLRLRDLPSFYACATGLLAQMKYQLENGDEGDRLLDEASDFGMSHNLEDLQASNHGREALEVLRASLAR